MGVDFIGYSDYSRNELSLQPVVSQRIVAQRVIATASCRCRKLSLQQVDLQRVVGNDLLHNELVATSFRVPHEIQAASKSRGLVPKLFLKMVMGFNLCAFVTVTHANYAIENGM